MSDSVLSAAFPQAIIPQSPPIAVPARPSVIHRSYRPLFETFSSHPGKWFTVLPAGISGESLAGKRRNLLFAARSRGLRLQTSIQDNQIFARLVVDTEEVTRG